MHTAAEKLESISDISAYFAVAGVALMFIRHECGSMLSAPFLKQVMQMELYLPVLHNWSAGRSQQVTQEIRALKSEIRSRHSAGPR